MRRLTHQIVVLLAGVGIHYGALMYVDRYVTVFPRVADLLIDNWPRFNFGWGGELFFFRLPQSPF